MKANCNGYVQINNTKKGRTYQHILEAEKKLGRNLKEGEVVHHIDQNRSNNNLDNLLVFKTTSDHMRHHNLKEEDQRLERLEDGAFICLSLKPSYKPSSRFNNRILSRPCGVCGIPTKNAKFCSVTCSNSLKSPKIVNRKATKRIYGEDLHKLVWSTPIETLRNQFGVSGNAIRKWCKLENIKTPTNGFWNKVYSNKLDSLYCPIWPAETQEKFDSCRVYFIASTRFNDQSQDVGCKDTRNRLPLN